MKKISLFLFFSSLVFLTFALLYPRAHAAGQALTKEDVVTLIARGVPEDEIVWTLERTRSEFSLTDDDRKWLKKNGATDWICIVMDMSPEKRSFQLPVYYGKPLSKEDVIRLSRKVAPHELCLMVAHTQSKFPPITSEEKKWLQGEGVHPLVIMLMQTQTENAKEKPFLQRGKIDRGGEPVRGGKYYEEAAPIAPGTYRLDHQLKANEFDYFRVRVKNGQGLACSVRTTDASANGGIAVHSADRTVLVRADVYGNNRKNQCDYYVFDAPEGEKELYIVIGNGDPANTDVIYEIAVSDLYDAASGRDAGSYFDSPLELEPRAKEYACYLPTGDVDMFAVPVKKGQALTASVVPESPAGYFRLVFYNEAREATSDRWNSPGSIATLSAPAPDKDAKLFIKIERSGADPVGAYTLKIDIG